MCIRDRPILALLFAKLFIRNVPPAPLAVLFITQAGVAVVFISTSLGLTVKGKLSALLTIISELIILIQH